MIYKIEVTKKQLELINMACEVVGRIMALNQFNDIHFQCMPYAKYSDEIDFLLKKLENINVIAPNSKEDGNILLDLWQVFRHRLAWDRNPEGEWYVDFNEPLKRSFEPLAYVENENKNNPELRRTSYSIVQELRVEIGTDNIEEALRRIKKWKAKAKQNECKSPMKSRSRCRIKKENV